MKKDKNQTPVPKASSGKKLSEEKTPELEKNIKNAEAGAAKKTSATKTPQKIQEGRLDSKNKK